MKQFLLRLWNSPLKASLAATLAITLGFLVNHYSGADGEVSLPAKSVVNVILLWGGSLFAIGGVGFSYYKECEKLKKGNEEEQRLSQGVLFKRGRRTNGEWMPFCPSCEKPAKTDVLIECPDHKSCGWQTLKDKRKIAQIIEGF